VSYYMFLDDERNLGDVTWVVLPSKIDHNWVTVRNYDEFVKTVISFGVPQFVAFDHDLADEHYKVMQQEVEASRYTAFVDDEHGGLNLTFDYGNEKTGYDCAKWLVDFCADRGLKFPSYAVHSMNPVGAKRIRDYVQWAQQKIGI
jgi:hypothetical protein